MDNKYLKLAEVREKIQSSIKSGGYIDVYPNEFRLDGWFSFEDLRILLSYEKEIQDVIK